MLLGGWSLGGLVLAEVIRCDITSDYLHVLLHISVLILIVIIKMAKAFKHGLASRIFGYRLRSFVNAIFLLIFVAFLDALSTW